MKTRIEPQQVTYRRLDDSHGGGEAILVEDGFVVRDHHTGEWVFIGFDEPNQPQPLVKRDDAGDPLEGEG